MAQRIARPVSTRSVAGSSPAGGTYEFQREESHMSVDNVDRHVHYDVSPVSRCAGVCCVACQLGGNRISIWVNDVGFVRFETFDCVSRTPGEMFQRALTADVNGVPVVMPLVCRTAEDVTRLRLSARLVEVLFKAFFAATVSPNVFVGLQPKVKDPFSVRSAWAAINDVVPGLPFTHYSVNEAGERMSELFFDQYSFEWSWVSLDHSKMWASVSWDDVAGLESLMTIFRDVEAAESYKVLRTPIGVRVVP